MIFARDVSEPVTKLIKKVDEATAQHGDCQMGSFVVFLSDAEDLQAKRGRSWAYNEPNSQSGYGIIRHHLLQIDETLGFFGSIVEAGWHERSIHLVRSGQVNASAIDSHVLAVAMRDDPGLAAD